jgi:hypothetical protein
MPVICSNCGGAHPRWHCQKPQPQQPLSVAVKALRSNARSAKPVKQDKPTADSGDTTIYLPSGTPFNITNRDRLAAISPAWVRALDETEFRPLYNLIARENMRRRRAIEHAIVAARRALEK